MKSFEDQREASIVSVFTRSIKDDEPSKRVYFVEPDKRLVTRIRSNVYQFATLLACEEGGKSRDHLPKSLQGKTSADIEQVEKFKGSKTYEAMNAIRGKDVNAIELHSCTGGIASVMDERIHASRSFSEMNIPTTAYGRGAICSASAGMFIHANRRLVQYESVLKMHGRALVNDAQMLADGSASADATDRIRNYAVTDYRDIYSKRFQDVVLGPRILMKLFDHVQANKTPMNPRIDIAFRDADMKASGICTEVCSKRELLEDFLTLTRGHRTLSSRSRGTDAEMTDFFKRAPATKVSSIHVNENEYFYV